MRTIVGMKLNQVSKRLARHYGMKTVIADSLMDALTDACLLPDTGGAQHRQPAEPADFAGAEPAAADAHGGGAEATVPDAGLG
ncbi:Uncharacterised protein [Leclercia adecarboxylata]|uniref:Uncharacterized protein n=1 Tax=Leclercia adecarboxylata TaxID=83655 RepID=A0A4U9HZ93_9ENTR|nr:Uncharacterised protein [Leclercia adecarboxylata]